MRYEDRLLVVKDTIQELGNIGIGAAATSLSILTHLSVQTDTSELRFLDYSQIFQQVHVEEQVIGILFPFDKDIRGFGLFVLEKQLAAYLLENEMHTEFHHLDTANISMLQEICSIMMSSYLASIAETTKMKVRIQLPALSIDMKGSIINNGLSFILQQNKESYCIDHEFKVRSTNNHLFFLLTLDCIKNIMETLEGKI